MARSLAGPAQGGRRPGLEGGGPKTGKVATNPGVGSGPNLGTTRSWSNAARKLEKRGSRQRPAAADDWKNQYLSIISIVLKTACPSTPRSAAPGCLFCRRPLTRRRRPAVPLVAPPAAPSRRPLGSSSPPTPTRRLPGPPVSTGCPAGRRRLCRLLRRPLLPVGLSGVPLRRRRPAASRGCRSRLVAPSAASSRRPLGSSSPPTPTRRLPGLPVSTGCPPPPAAPSRRTLGSSSPPTPTRRLPGPPVSTGCCAGLFFPPAIPIDPPVSPFAGPPRRTGGVCLPFGRNGGRKCRSRLEYCAEFPSFVTPKHQYHEKPPPRTLCVCGLLQCSAGRMLRA